MEELLEQLAKQIQHQNKALERIADAVEKISGIDSTRPKYVYPIVDFPTFNWTTIEATVTKSDRYGAAIVSWRNQMYVRRSKLDFGEHIWFSRSIGKDDTGRNLYETLIRFVPAPKVRSLPQDIVDAAVL